MRQTSRAVALLLALESANAAEVVTAQQPATIDIGGQYTTVFNPDSSAIGAPTNSDQLNNRQAGYTGTARVFDKSSPTTNTGWTDATFRQAKLVDGKLTTTLSASTIPAGQKGSNCMQCIRGKGVWCSRTFSYLSSSTTVQAEGVANLSGISADAAAQLGGAALDQGSCCDSATQFNLFVGTRAKPVRTGSTDLAPNNNASSCGTNGVKMVPPACVAMASPNAVVASSSTDNLHLFGISRIDATTVTRSSWWCSNGLYKKVTTAGTIKLNSQQTIGATQNKRMELALVGCPQTTARCGYDKNAGVTIASPKVAFELTTSATTWAVTIPVGDTNGMNTLNKCTWVVHSTVLAPTWTMSSAGTGSAELGLVGSNWQIHAMEYTADTITNINNESAKSGSLSIASDTTGLIKETDALANGNLTPLFTMPAASFATLRTWYGEGTMAIDGITQQSATWLSPGQAPIANTKDISAQLAQVQSQTYGNMVNVPVSNYIAGPAGTAVLGNYNNGIYNNATPFDLRQMRYLPAQVALTSHAAGTIAQGKYTTALSAYKTAQTTWDNYVAILAKNSSQDAFAALFSPPKAPTVPPLPNKPWVPAAYTGYTWANPQQVAGFTGNAVPVKNVANPAATQVWTNRSAAETLGGWGTFTASIFTFRNGWGKSFGTIGYSGDDNKLKMSDVWNYKWTCSTATGAVVNSVAPASTLTDTQCAPTYTVTAPGDAAKPTALTAQNGVKMVSIVSLWSTTMIQTSLATTLWSVNGLTITFTGSAWKSSLVGLTAITLPTGATDAKSLTGLAGAQALVASSAAALAVAAALY